MKFGGTSLADAKRMRSAARRVAERVGRKPLVVVSALAGVTDRLVAIARAAEARNQSRSTALLEELGRRHLELLAELAPPSARERAGIERDLEASADLARGIALLGECSARTRDALLAQGELLSHRLFVFALAAEGVPAAAIDPRRLVPTDDDHGQATVDRAELARRCSELVVPCLARGLVPVTGGFVGATSEAATTTLGRGGSDLSATLLGVALEASAVEIWTDVDGLMSADPRVVPEARTLREIGFRAASELAFFGANVLHPATIKPAVQRGIPVHVKNSLRPESAGTVVRELAPEERSLTGVVRAVAWKTSVLTISVSSTLMVGVHGFLARLFAVFDRHRTPVDVVTTSETSVSMTIERADRLDAIVRELSELGRVQVARDTALVCLVGERLLDHPELVGAVLSTLAGVPLRMFCLGSSDVNLTLVVESARAEEVVRRLHARFLEPSRGRRDSVPAEESLGEPVPTLSRALSEGD